MSNENNFSSKTLRQKPVILLARAKNTVFLQSSFCENALKKWPVVPVIFS